MKKIIAFNISNLNNIEEVSLLAVKLVSELEISQLKPVPGLETKHKQELTELEWAQKELHTCSQDFLNEESLSIFQNKVKKVSFVLLDQFYLFQSKLKEYETKKWSDALEALDNLVDLIESKQETRSDKSYHSGSAGWVSGNETDPDDEKYSINYREKRNGEGIRVRYYEDDPSNNYQDTFTYFNEKTGEWVPHLSEELFLSTYADVKLPSLFTNKERVQIKSELHLATLPGRYEGDEITYSNITLEGKAWRSMW